MESTQKKILKKIEDRIEKVVEKSDFLKRHQNSCYSCCHVLTLILAAAYVASLCVCIFAYIMAAQEVADVMSTPLNDPETVKSEVVAWLNGKSTRYNLEATIQFILNKFMDVLNNNANGFIENLKVTLDGLGPHLQVNKIKAIYSL